MNIYSWGNLKKCKVNSLYKKNEENVSGKNFLTIGNLRSYGDQPLSDKIRLNIFNDKIIDLNKKIPFVECESGLLLKDLRYMINKYNLDLPIVPGTAYITVGGAISNDIHGKSHHYNGSFGNHIISIKILIDGNLYICSNTKNKNIFKAVIGGSGLIGHIVSAKIKLLKTNKFNYEQESIVFNGLDGFFDLSKSTKNFTDTVAWFDCLNKNGRGVFFRANRTAKKAKLKKRKISYPFLHKFSLINYISIKIFNTLFYYYHYFFTIKKKIITFDDFHHPLDKIKNWNRIYGQRGFYQFQCVLPEPNMHKGSKEILEIISKNKVGSFLCVLKMFGHIKSLGLMSFPMPGVTLAIDFPNNGAKTVRLVKQLNEIAIKHDGKIYLAKDSLLTSDQVRSCYKELNLFLKFKNKSINSMMSRRLDL